MTTDATPHLDLKGLATILRGAFEQWNDDNAPRHGAALAFYSMLSIGPLLLLIIALAGLVFGEEAASRHLMTELTLLIGAEGGQAINHIVARSRNEDESLIAAMIGFATLVVSATGFFGQLQASLNRIWNVPPVKSGWKDFVSKRLLSFSMIAGICLLLLFSLVVSAGLSAMTDMLGATLSNIGAQILNLVVSLIATTALFAMTFKVLPDVDIQWRDVWVGAGVTSLLFAVGKSLIGLYLGHSAFSSTYGAAGSLIVLLVWVYYSAQIFFFGAEITEVYARYRGDRFEPRTERPPVPA